MISHRIHHCWALATLVFGLAFASKTIAECYESSISRPSPFLGNHGEMFQLLDGSLWEVQHEYSYLYAYYPAVVICPDEGYLLIDDERINVVLRAPPPSTDSRSDDASPSSLESRIDGEFEGWEGETIVKLSNGQIWQQAEYYYYYHYAYSPAVLLFKANGMYKMAVEGVDRPVGVVQLK